METYGSLNNKGRLNNQVRKRGPPGKCKGHVRGMTLPYSRTSSSGSALDPYLQVNDWGALTMSDSISKYA